MEQHWRIATRGSPLALWQAEHVRTALLGRCPDARVELVPITSTGDAHRDRPLSGLGRVGVFTKEIQEALLDRRADVAVHSLKDLPTDPTPGLTLAAVPLRGPVEDVLLTRDGQPLWDLRPRAQVATSSPRRHAMLRRQRPDFEIVPVRGNVDTRLRKLDRGDFDALVLARAGLSRLDLLPSNATILSVDDFLPAPGQGALAIECRADDARTLAALAAINDRLTRAAVDAERAVLKALGGGCSIPLGALAQGGETLKLRATLLAPDGSAAIDESLIGAADDPVGLGSELARRMRERGASTLLDLRQTPRDGERS